MLKQVVRAGSLAKPGSAARPLKVKMLSDPNVAERFGFFTVSSTKAAVLAVQGTPTPLTDTEWGYGPSRVFFSYGRVVGWRMHPSAPLNVKVLPSGSIDGNHSYITVGSSKDEGKRPKCTILTSGT